jgi:hypothetical protein
MLMAFLCGLPTCLGAGDAMVGKVCEVLWNGFLFIQGTEALFDEGAALQSNRNPHLVNSATSVARNEYRVQDL